jgi:thioesterase domain-containing protein
MDSETKDIIDEVANALATAAPLSTALRRGLGDAAQQVIEIEAAIARATAALKRLAPKGS